MHGDARQEQRRRVDVPQVVNPSMGEWLSRTRPLLGCVVGTGGVVRVTNHEQDQDEPEGGHGAAAHHQVPVRVCPWPSQSGQVAPSEAIPPPPHVPHTHPANSPTSRTSEVSACDGGGCWSRAIWPPVRRPCRRPGRRGRGGCCRGS